MINGYSKILIIRFSSFGDIILTFPLIKVLRSKFPKCKIHFLTLKKNEEILRLNPYVDKLITYNFGPLSKLKESIIEDETYDVILDLHKNFRSLYLTLFSGIPVKRIIKQSWKKFLLVEFKINKFTEIIPVYKKYMLTAGDSLADNDYKFNISPLRFNTERRFNERYIVIAPSSRHFNKTYPKEKFLNIVQSIRATKVVLVGDNSKRDMDICSYIESNSPGTINLCGQLSYTELANVLYNAEYVMCNDSGVLHLSEALGKKVYAIFGATVREFGFFPQLPGSVVFENHELACRPCTHVGLPGCPKTHFKCMNDLKIKIKEYDTPYLT